MLPTQIATWSDERARTRATMANLIARSAHEDELIAVYFNSNAILAAECAELFAKGQERASVSFQAKPLVAVVGGASLLTSVCDAG